MRELGLACWGMRELELRQQLELCARLGVRLTELDIANAPGGLSLACGAKELQQTARLFEAYGIPPRYAATGNDFTMADGGEVSAQIEKVRQVIEICEGLGIGFLRIFAGFSPAQEVTEERFGRMLDALETVCRYADSRKVRLVLELHGGVKPWGTGVTHFHSVSTRWDMAERLWREGPEELLFLLDPANLCAVGEDPVRYYELLKGRIAYMHAKEFVRLSDGGLAPAACGAGTFDWKAFFENTGDFDGPVLIEYEQTQDVEEGMRASLNCLRPIFSGLVSIYRKEEIL